MSRKKLVKTHIPTVNPAISETEKPFTEWTPEYINNYLKKEIPDINSVCQNTPELAKELMKKTTYQFCGMRAQYIKKLNEKENFPSENQMKKLNHITIFIDENTLEAIVNLSKAKMERLLEELLEPDETSIWEDADWIFEIENVTKMYVQIRRDAKNEHVYIRTATIVADTIPHPTTICEYEITYDANRQMRLKEKEEDAFTLMAKIPSEELGWNKTQTELWSKIELQKWLDVRWEEPEKRTKHVFRKMALIMSMANKLVNNETLPWKERRSHKTKKSENCWIQMKSPIKTQQITKQPEPKKEPEKTVTPVNYTLPVLKNHKQKLQTRVQP